MIRIDADQAVDRLQGAPRAQGQSLAPGPPAVEPPAVEPSGAEPHAGEPAIPDEDAGVAASVADSARSGLELAGLVVAPTTLVTAFAFFFGWTFTNARASYFGIDPSTLGFSTQDYLLRSADALFVPLGTILLLTLAGVTAHGMVCRALGDRRHIRVFRVVARSAIGLGGLLLAVGLVAVFRRLSFSPSNLFPSASPGIGIAGLAYGLHLTGRIQAAVRPGLPPSPSGRSRVVAIGLVAFVVVMSAFWTASKYADALGRGRAVALARGLGSRPQVTVYTPTRLGIDVANVTEQRLTGPDLAYRYRYSGLRLLVRSGGRYFLLPDGWTPRGGTAIVLGDRPDYRFEFGVRR